MSSGYARHPGGAWPRPPRRPRRGRGPARSQRRRQDHHAPVVLGHREGAARDPSPILGEPVHYGAPHRMARRGLGHVPEDRSLFFQLTVDENLRLGLRGVKGSQKQAYDRALEMFPALAPLQGPTGRPAVRRRAADAGRRPRPRRPAEGADDRRDEPRAGADHRGADAAARPPDRRRRRARACSSSSSTSTWP